MVMVSAVVVDIRWLFSAAVKSIMPFFEAAKAQMVVFYAIPTICYRKCFVYLAVDDKMCFCTLAALYFSMYLSFLEVHDATCRTVDQERQL